ncbi:ABC transporter substrate-binding protein [Mucisphaera calidilacus]|uniref:Bacterial extracellular solute-binding protein n=1 Tax=Mucisphaera calidilacus TaxID=2527982 RepID=A0A518BWR5_9BACT|nr:ABC transporter substrate-binding protein [Mucisphaera calidilacus]QDU71418.1 Bacterial extracellular solute-binding protein [Mucisphaera calidilacus]
MKYLFGSIFAALVVASFVIRATFPDTATRVPVLYWVTDPAPARVEQVNRFHQWLIETGRYTEDVIADEAGLARFRREVPEALIDDIIVTQPALAGVLGDEPDLSVLPVTVRVPACEMRLDTANRDDTKQKVQAVSGVAADVMDVFNGSSMRMFAAMGVLRDVTEDAERLGFGLSETYAALRPEVIVDGRQYMYPCNVSSSYYTVNNDLFRSLGMEPPPRRWTFDEFERIGIAFCERANEGKRRRDTFFLNKIDWTRMHRGLGVSRFNETMTACVLDCAGYAEGMERGKRWMYEINIIPTPDDVDAFASARTYGGADPAMFGAGHFGMIEGGRYWLMQFREFDELGELGFAEPPHGGFPNTTIGTRGALVYKGTRYPELATLFLAYLASEKYNNLIVEDSDALPPNPVYAQSEAYLRPADHPNEWLIHGPAFEIAQTIAIGDEYSPFVLPTVVEAEINYHRDRFITGQSTAAEAARNTASAINQEIAKRLGREPRLVPEYEERVERQARIDALKASGEPIPASWIDNPFLKAYYRHLGMTRDDDGGGL